MHVFTIGNLGQDMIEQVAAVSPTPIPPLQTASFGPAPRASMRSFMQDRGRDWAPRVGIRSRNTVLRGLGAAGSVRRVGPWCPTCVPGGMWLRSNWNGLRGCSCSSTSGLRGIEPLQTGAILLGGLAALALAYVAIDHYVGKVRRRR